MDDGPALIASMAATLQGLGLPPARIPELAVEARRLNDAVRGGASKLTFDDDPASYAVLLSKTAGR
jgi:hypothetical protein